MLAGVSVDYYTKMERGNLRGVSEGVLEALARGLKLDDAERAHLLDLARAAGPVPRPRRRPAKQSVRPAVERLLDAITGAPALVQDGRLNVLAANQLGSRSPPPARRAPSAVAPSTAGEGANFGRLAPTHSSWRDAPTPGVYTARARSWSTPASSPACDRAVLRCRAVACAKTERSPGGRGDRRDTWKESSTDAAVAWVRGSAAHGTCRSPALDGVRERGAVARAYRRRGRRGARMRLRGGVRE